MTIDNKTLYKLRQAVREDHMDISGFGIYIEGFEGGVSIYAIGGKAAYWKTVYGDNRRRFVHFIDSRRFTGNFENTRRVYDKDRVLDKNGLLDVNSLTDSLGGFSRNRVFELAESLFAAKQYGSFTVNGADFFKAVKCADAATRGEKERRVVIAARNGFLDLSAWTEAGDSGVWREVCEAGDMEGAVSVDLGLLHLLLRKSGKIGAISEGGNIWI